MSNVDLARVEFAFVTINHFFFVPVTIGLAFLTALLQTAWHRSGKDEYLRLTSVPESEAAVSRGPLRPERGRAVLPGGRRAVGGGCDDPRPVLISPGDRRPGHVVAEQDFSGRVGSDHSVTALWRRKPVDTPLDAFRQQHRGERVEVVLVRQQQHGRDALQSRAAAGRPP
jgi:Cytochrome bd terminal oxidase subunit I